MELSFTIIPHFSLLFFISAMILYPRMAFPLGINYGRIADNIPEPTKVVPIIKSIGATRVKLYDADPSVLKAFANTNIEIIIGLGNEYLSTMKDSNKALNWIKINVQCWLPLTKITCIVVGNEVLTLNDSSLNDDLFPAMQSVYNALVTLHLEKQVSVTTAHSLAVLDTSYPPSAGKFRGDLVGCISKILDFHLKTDSPFLINAYPFLAYKSDPKQVSLDFVLFQGSRNGSGGVVDPATNLHYDNMLFAQIDAVHSALEKVGCKKVCVQISESGWPSKGDPDEAGATEENAKKYNGNLIKLVQQKKGTPMRPDVDLNIYVFALFNENLKPGPTSERNFGLFKPDGTPAYNLGLAGVSYGYSNTSSSSGGSSGGNSGGGSNSSPPGGSSNGYMSITSDVGKVTLHKRMLIFWLVLSPITLRAFQH